MVARQKPSRGSLSPVVSTAVLVLRMRRKQPDPSARSQR